jgi:hypothetical protein
MKLGKIEDKKIALVEFIRDDQDKLMPFSIQTKDDYDVTEYNVEYCKSYEQFYYSCSRGGGDLAVEQPRNFYIEEEFIDKCVGFEEYKEARLIEFPYTQKEWEEWVEDALEGETVYCCECDDELPTERYPEPCDHVWWCDECGWWSTPDERCEEKYPHTPEED